MSWRREEIVGHGQPPDLVVVAQPHERSRSGHGSSSTVLERKGWFTTHTVIRAIVVFDLEEPDWEGDCLGQKLGTIVFVRDSGAVSQDCSGLTLCVSHLPFVGVSLTPAVPLRFLGSEAALRPVSDFAQHQFHACLINHNQRCRVHMYA
jgi:hypothetical protein